MDLPIRPKPSNAHKPRVRIVERRETVYETRQPIFATDAAGQPVPTGEYRDGMVYAQLSGAMTYAPNGAAAAAKRARINGASA
jgi:hypothetical protein